MSIDVKRLGSRLKEIRELKGLSISSVADKSGLAKSYLSKLESGEVANPGLQTVSSIGRALDVTVPEILGEVSTTRDAQRRGGALSPAEEQRAYEELVTQMPESLRTFLTLEEERGARLPADVVRSLAGIRLRGKQPETIEDWQFLYSAMMRSIRRA